MNILDVFKRDRKREVLAPYVHVAALEVCMYLRALRPGEISADKVESGLRVLAHNRLLMPTEIATDFEDMLRRKSNDNDEAANLAVRMKAYAKRYP